MQNSILQVFSVYQNVNRLIKSKNAPSYFDIFKSASIIWYNRSHPNIKRFCERVYNEIENHFYSLEEFALTILVENIYNKRCELSSLTSKNINSTKDIFSKERFLLDQQLILDMNAQTHVKSLADYFSINRMGVSIVYELIMHEKRFLSPYFFLRYEDKAIQEMEECDKMVQPSEEYNKFKRVINIIKLILTTKTQQN